MTQSEPRKAGRPKGIAREGKYGSGVKTKVVRLPVELAERAVEILDTLEAIKSFVHAWEQEIEASGTSPRYDKARIMIQELKNIL